MAEGDQLTLERLRELGALLARLHDTENELDAAVSAEQVARDRVQRAQLDRERALIDYQHVMFVMDQEERTDDRKFVRLYRRIVGG